MNHHRIYKIKHEHVNYNNDNRKAKVGSKLLSHSYLLKIFTLITLNLLLNTNL